MKSKKVTERMCVGCRQMKDKAELIRVVRLPDGTLAADETGKAQGRGAYVCKSIECINLAVKKKGFERSFGMKVSGSDVKALAEEIKNLAER